MVFGRKSFSEVDIDEATSENAFTQRTRTPLQSPPQTEYRNERRLVVHQIATAEIFLNEITCPMKAAFLSPEELLQQEKFRRRQSDRATDRR